MPKRPGPRLKRPPPRPELDSSGAPPHGFLPCYVLGGFFCSSLGVVLTLDVETTAIQWFSEPQGLPLFTPNQQGGKTKR